MSQEKRRGKVPLFFQEAANSIQKELRPFICRTRQGRGGKEDVLSKNVEAKRWRQGRGVWADGKWSVCCLVPAAGVASMCLKQVPAREVAHSVGGPELVGSQRRSMSSSKRAPGVFGWGRETLSEVFVVRRRIS